MTTWGAEKYGEPCGECGYSWSLTQDDALEIIASLPERYRELLRGRDASMRHPDLTWSACAYVSHVADNVRIFAERIAALDVGDYYTAYEPDELAAARRYEAIPIAAALWSLEHASRDFAEAMALVDGKQVSVSATEGGPESFEDVVKSIAHDAYHHIWDVRRTVQGEIA